MRTLVNPPLTDDLLDRLEEIWVAVTEHGGAVGFTPPVDPVELSTAVAGYWDRVIDGEIDLVVAVDRDGTAHAFAFLVLSGGSAVAGHRAEVAKLMRDPGLAGQGIGAAVLERLEEQARERGVTLLTLTVRDRTGRERFYEHHGYRLVARLPGWLRIDGRPRDELLMAKDLTLPADPSAQSEHVRDGAVEPPESVHVRTGSGRPGALTLPVKRLDPDLPLPTYARAGDAGMDLLAREDRVLPAGTRCVMPTGVAVAIPEGHVGLIHPRSGLAVREGLSIVNTPGTIDAGYRGEIKVPLVNLDPSATIRIKRGERIAQMLIQQVEQAELVEVEELPHGIRGEQGFGSTGR